MADFCLQIFGRWCTAVSTSKWPFDTTQCLLRAGPFTVLGE